MVVRKYVKLTDRKGTSIFEVDEDSSKMTRNIVRFICDVGKQQSEEKTQELADFIVKKLNS